MSAIMMSQLTVTDPEKFQDYLEKSKAIVGRYGAELLFAGAFQENLNGVSPSHERVVIAKFPDHDALRNWHEDPDYKDLIPLREASSHQIMNAYSA